MTAATSCASTCCTSMPTSQRRVVPKSIAKQKNQATKNKDGVGHSRRFGTVVSHGSFAPGLLPSCSNVDEWPWRSRSAMASGLAGYRSRTAAGEISRSGGGRIIDPKGRPRWPWEAVIALARRPLSPLGASSPGSLNAAGRAAFAYAVRVIGAAQTGWRSGRECWPARLVFPR